jgi:1-acyl-sn-glycerol-3-phosphate acyltransferase
LGLKNLKGISGPLLIIGNHKSVLDAFALGAALPLSRRFFPIRFMGKVNEFDHNFLQFLHKIGFVKFFYLIFGVFPAIRGKGLETALQTPKKIIKNRGIVFIHPEGGAIKRNEIGQFKRGATVLAKSTKVKILPVAFKIRKDSPRREFCISFGQPFFMPENLSPEEGSEYVRRIIIDLYNQLLDKQ